MKPWAEPRTMMDLPQPILKVKQSMLHRVTLGLTKDSWTTPQDDAPPRPHPTRPDGHLSLSTSMGLVVQRYRFAAVLGEGTSAQVIAAEDTWTGRMVALKCMKFQYGQAGVQEFRLLRFLHSRDPQGLAGLVRPLALHSHSGHVCVALERLHGGHLLDLLQETHALEPGRRVEIIRVAARQLLASLDFLRRQGVVHADIKLENVMLTRPTAEVLSGQSPLSLRLVDFGTAFTTELVGPSRATSDIQTLHYRAPEVLLGLPYGPAIDTWSVGCVLAELALLRPLFPVHSKAELLREATVALGHAPRLPEGQGVTREAERLGLARLQSEFGTGVTTAAPLYHSLHSLDPQLAQLIVLGLLRWNPEDRLTPAEALRHPFTARDAGAPLAPLHPERRFKGMVPNWSQATAPATEAAAVPRSAQQGRVGPGPGSLAANMAVGQGPNPRPLAPPSRPRPAGTLSETLFGVTRASGPGPSHGLGAAQASGPSFSGESALRTPQASYPSRRWRETLTCIWQRGPVAGADKGGDGEGEDASQSGYEALAVPAPGPVQPPIVPAGRPVGADAPEGVSQQSQLDESWREGGGLTRKAIPMPAEPPAAPPSSGTDADPAASMQVLDGQEGPGGSRGDGAAGPGSETGGTPGPSRGGRAKKKARVESSTAEQASAILATGPPVTSSVGAAGLGSPAGPMASAGGSSARRQRSTGQPWWIATQPGG